MSVLLLVVVLVGGCATLSWYGQAVHGQLDLLSKRELIADLVNDPATDPELSRRLALVLEIRQFAHAELGLPDSRSYRHYADLEREAAVWNVVATPAYSLSPKTWCYPVAGCLAYRGYFSLERARDQARKLADDGHDVAVSPAVAYSTLGWFADPVLNTMMAWDDARLAGFIFHELAHEKLFVRGDTAFNEAYATLVERHGVRRWLVHRGEDDQLADWEADRALSARLIDALLAARVRLVRLYDQALTDSEMARAKQAEFERLTDELRQLGQTLGTDRFDGWTRQPLNNAHLALVATYEDGVGAFERLLEQCDNDLTCLHQRAAELAAGESDARRAFLQDQAD